MSESKTDIHISSSVASNYTNSGFTTIRDGFDPKTPLVGTETHEFTFVQDPWSVVSTSGTPVVMLSKIILSVSKVFNPNNTTNSFVVLNWTPEYFYMPKNIGQPNITLTLKDRNSGVLGAYSLEALERVCGKWPTHSRKHVIDVLIFDLISAAAFTLGKSSWEPC